MFYVKEVCCELRKSKIFRKRFFSFFCTIINAELVSRVFHVIIIVMFQLDSSYKHYVPSNNDLAPKNAYKDKKNNLAIRTSFLLPHKPIRARLIHQSKAVPRIQCSKILSIFAQEHQLNLLNASQTGFTLLNCLKMADTT